MLIVDRFTDGVAVLETDDGHIEVPRAQVDPAVREGDVVTLHDDGVYRRDSAATDERRARIAALQDKLFS